MVESQSLSKHWEKGKMEREEETARGREGEKVGREVRREKVREKAKRGRSKIITGKQIIRGCYAVCM